MTYATTAEVCAALRIHEATLARLRRDSERASIPVPVVRIRRQLRWDTARLGAWVEAVDAWARSRNARGATAAHPTSPADRLLAERLPVATPRALTGSGAFAFLRRKEHGDPEGCRTKPWPKLTQAAEAFVAELRRGYEVWRCSEVIRVTVQVRPWVEAHCPEWLEASP